ncbi:Ferrous iron transport protein B [Thermogutta terrifontis]|uniref:Ferrous iron transport protein B n=1 Tax=Thermogutta terrifontis TaxID=1331910 RepID=A0A286RAC1_9BACT|nr:ferrous iron transport protein B [Thermogutta terrifontis]ASV72908.1 Ferrous iron transport protein B [Thermogutta terrifontis]
MTRVTAPKKCVSVALVGNPNTGKSTLFSALVGVYQRVGNYPGVTVEKRTGRFEFQNQTFEVIDLPGLYSLSPRSRDELVAVNVLLGREPGVEPVDVIVCVVDASNLERNLYLVSQLLELGLPMVVALTMVDVAERQGIQIDVEELSRRLGVPVVPVQAHRGIGVGRVRQVLHGLIEKGIPPSPRSPLPREVQLEIERIFEDLESRGLLARIFEPASEDSRASHSHRSPAILRFWLERLLLDAGGFLRQNVLDGKHPDVLKLLVESQQRLEQAGFAVPEDETHFRYEWVRQLLEGVVKAPEQPRITLTDRLDAVLTHRVWGLMIFAAVMLLMFQAVFRLAEPFNRVIDFGVQSCAALVRSQLQPGAFRDLLVDGVISGVGAVLTFIPQIAILFIFIAILEDCGYVARAAVLMDRFMSRIGLSGKSFIPMLSSFACAVPGIMATRTIDNERDRLTTILVTPLLTCSARLPVYALLIAVFIPDYRYLGGVVGLQGLVLASLYVLGVATAVTVALLLKRTIFRGRSPTFVIELPSYKWPSPRTVILRVWERVVVFLRNAGTIIAAISVLVWAALYYPHDSASIDRNLLNRQAELRVLIETLPPESPQREAWEKELDQVGAEIAAAYQRNSILGRMGRAIEPIFRPLGWDWRIGTAVLASFPAREVVVATLGVMFNLGDISSDDVTSSQELHARLRSATREGSNEPVFNIPVALSLMVFYALCAQCAATLAVIRRETNSWRWPVFTFAYMTTLAYLGALVTYQLASRILTGGA